MTKKYIEILDIIPLRGPNIWTYRPVLEAWIDIGDLEDFPSNTLPGFYERLTAWLPSLVEHRCSYGERGGFLQRVREGTWPGHILEHVTLELQNLAGMQSGFGKARQTGKRGVYKVVVRSRHEGVSRACLHAARDLVMAAIDDRPFEINGTVERLREMADALCLGPSTACIVNAAAERSIPSIRLTEGNLVQLGYGARQRRIWTAETDRTSAIAQGIASDKNLTKTLLRSCGIPVPEGSVVSGPEEAWEAAEDIGLPVVVKPSDANHGRGVSAELVRREQVEAAYRVADAEGSEVIVERFIRGSEHRLLVVGSKLVAAARGESLWITGDGQSSVAELIDQQLNTDPRRGAEEEFPLDLIRLDAAPAVVLELQRQGYDAASIPTHGARILVQRNGNVAIDVTDEVHPEVAAVACLATRIVGLDIAGIDLVAEDISRPLAEQGGAIVEINAGPGLLMHLKPAAGTPRPVGEAIVDHLFPAGESGRIPVVGITGSHGKSVVARLVARMLQLSGRHVGLAVSDGLYLDQRPIRAGDCTSWSEAHRLLMNRTVQAAVFENGSRAILGEGLAYDRCQVGVVTNLDPADLPAEFFINAPDQLFNVLRTQVDVVLPDGVAVLNADDARVAEMAPLCDGEVIFFALSAGNALVAEQLGKGGRALFVRDARIVLASAEGETALSALAALPPCPGIDAERQTQNVLAALGAALALGISQDLICAVVETYAGDRPLAAADGY